jgi:hypothetical protein
MTIKNELSPVEFQRAFVLVFMIMRRLQTGNRIALEATDLCHVK